MSSQLHFVLIPLLSQGHLIPVVDIALLLARRNVTVTIITTPLNSARISNSVNHARKSGLPIRVLEVPLAATEAGLPEGCESADLLPSGSFIKNFFSALCLWQKPVEQLFEELEPSPSCIISDKNIPWTADTATKFKIPRLLFDGTSCFKLMCDHNLHVSKAYETVSESDPVVIPGLPHKIELTRSQLPGFFNPGKQEELQEVRRHIKESAEGAYGMLINTFEDLEHEYIKSYQKAKGHKVWCIGPLSLSSTENSDKAQRGNKASIDENQCIKWLDSWPPGSVIYACLGSLNRVTPPQLIELGLALEASKRPFIWVIRGGYKKDEMEKWIDENGFEQRVKERGLLIRGWAPQVLILSHPAIGGFLTHCGWNSTLEGICAGVPMITWPLFAEQFLNEKLIVQVLEIGVRVGVKVMVHFGEEEDFGVLVKREQIEEAIENVMCERKECEERRDRARKLAGMAKNAVEEGGSSYLDISLLIEDIKQQAIKKSS